MRGVPAVADWPRKEGLEPEAILDFFRAHLKQVVTIHHEMFEKLLGEKGEIPLELAELFEDAGNTYLRISERISEDYLARNLLNVEQFPRRTSDIE